jgi:hypothetical protein
MYLGKTSVGSKHDFSLLKEEFQADWLEEYFLCVDLGYQGIDKYYAHKGLIQGIKRRKGQKLSRQEKDYNRAVSRLRIKVEHAIAGMKRYYILYHKLRVKALTLADEVVELGAGLWNYYLKSKTSTA